MYAKLRLLGHIQEKQKHNLFLRDRTGQVRVPKSNKVQYIYQDINLSPVPAGVMASLACSFRNSAMSCETDFVSIAISLCASGEVYGFISL